MSKVTEAFRYCIGKASRHNEGDTVTSVPFVGKGSDVESQLRRKVYDNPDLAAIACEVATLYNPVGFVVLKLISK